MGAIRRNFLFVHLKNRDFPVGSDNCFLFLSNINWPIYYRLTMFQMGELIFQFLQILTAEVAAEVVL